MTGIGDLQAAPSGDTDGETGATDQFAAWEKGTRRWYQLGVSGLFEEVWRP